MSKPSSRGRPCPLRAASRSVRNAGWGSAAMVSASSIARRTHVPLRHDLVDQSDPLCLARIDDTAGDDQLDCAAVAEDAGEALRAAVGQPDVPPPAGHTECRVLVGDREVGPARPLEAAGVGDAVDGRDGRLVDVVHRDGPSTPSAGLASTRSSPANAAFRSPPAQNATSPAPVRTPTNALSSARNLSHASTSSRCVCGPMAFMRSGRLMVMMVTGPRVS